MYYFINKRKQKKLRRVKKEKIKNKTTGSAVIDKLLLKERYWNALIRDAIDSIAIVCLYICDTTYECCYILLRNLSAIEVNERCKYLTTKNEDVLPEVYLAVMKL